MNGSFEIEVASLRGVVKDVIGVVEARNTIPVLSNVLLTVDRQSLTVAGTDLDLMVQRRVPLAQAEPFTVTVEAVILDKIATKLPSDAEAKIKLADGKLTVSAGRSRFQLPTLPADDFPIMQLAARDACEFVMQSIYLGAAIGLVRHAISTEETRYYLNGIFMHAPDGQDLRFAATDSHRLARGIVALPDGADGVPDTIMPRKLTKLLSGLLDRHEGEVQITVTDRLLRFEMGDTIVTGKAIDGQYPDYARIIPVANPHRLDIDRDALIAAIGRVVTVATDKTRVAKLSFSRDLLVVSVTSSEKGEAREELPCGWAGPAMEIGFNSRYLLDVLGQLTADSVEGLFADPAAPVLWRDREDANGVFVVMPSRI
ncbi:MAG: DNA polymerase III subunit beta [Sphingomonas sp.]|uniref:DNA polymerase III subunit beta n=1 Tax=Sphingomonas sp. TaxID=28214 RepID=UPI00257F2CD2|nr:DNA polymerase III subunit beta [Sphingomonas sp.]MBQ1480647.1 DNA polymerase III subunit beta [Sphingomonas sp.]